jgi:hypothetical protein
VASATTQGSRSPRGDEQPRPISLTTLVRLLRCPAPESAVSVGD